jgi:hypothetical protein
MRTPKSRGRHRSRLQRINRFAHAGVERQPCVGNARDGQPRVLAEVADRLAHVLRASGAVETDHVHPERFERGHRARDVGAEEHAAAGVERDLRLERNAAPELCKEPLDARDRGLYLENVLRCLDE